jgi:hypothetical protein
MYIVTCFNSFLSSLEALDAIIKSNIEKKIQKSLLNKHFS